MQNHANKATIINLFVTICLFLALVIVIKSGHKPLEELLIRKSNGSTVKFQVAIARTPEEQEKGLMYREKLSKNEGMLFVLDQERPVDMWMKNTNIPLDIIFIGKNGVIKNIAKNTTPNSLKTISSQTSVIAVLEINAMLSDELSINENDIVLHPFFAATQ